jgi:hypothetical protein
LSLASRGRTIDPIGTQPPPRNVIPTEILGRPPVREEDFKASAEGDGFVLDMRVRAGMADYCSARTGEGSR